MISAEKSVYISYSWKKEKRKKTVEKIMAAFSAVGVEVKRDEKEIGYGYPIRAYMDELAAGGAIILVLSEPYIKSPNCMYELLEIYNHDRKKFRKRIFPVVLKGTRFHKATDRLPYIQFWEEETKRLKAYFASVDMTNIGTGSHQELRKYVEVTNKIDDLLSLIGDMNHLKEEDHLKDNFSALIERIFSVLPPSGGGGTDKTGREKTAGDQFSSEGGNQQIAKDHGTINNNYFFAPKESVPPSGHQKIFFGVPNLPPNHLPRPEYIDEFRAVLQKESNLGMEGMGGIGKSVLAAALAHDKAVQAAFPDGIFWLTFGQKVENDVLLAQQNNILKLLGNQEQENSIDLSRHKLNSVLHGKRCLFIIDDIWDSKHLKCFDLSGTACRFLLTSRKADVLDRLDMERKRIDLLSEEQALTMLAQYARCALADLPKAAAEIVKECGYLPLAVAAIGSMVRGKPADRWQLALRKLKEAKLDKISCKFDYQYENLFRALQVSVEALPEAQQQYYKTLAVFPEDVNIPESVIILSWEYCAFSDDAPQDVIDAIVDASLLTRVDNDSLRLHDLLRDYLISQAEDISALHKQLLEAYKAKYPGGWHTIPYEEPYYFHNYWHIHTRKAGNSAQARKIADTLLRRQPLLSLRGIQTALEVKKCNFSDIAFDLLQESRDPQVIAACLKKLGQSVKQEAWALLRNNYHPTVTTACLKILKDSARKEALILLNDTKYPNVIVECLNILGNDAAEDARHLLAGNQHPNVIVACLNILKDAARKDAQRLLTENQHPFVIATCLNILGDSAREDARCLLRKDQHPSVVSSCLKVLGKDAVEDARYFITHSYHGEIITTCLAILGDEAKYYARNLIKSNKDDYVLMSCIRVLGKEAESYAKRLIQNSKNRLIRSDCKKLLSSWQD